MLSETKLEGVKITLCVMIVLFLYFSERFVGVPHFWEGQVEN